MDVTAARRQAPPEPDWPGLYEALAVTPLQDLDAGQAGALAEAAWWLGKLDDSVAARERAFELRMAAGEKDAAALEAFLLSLALGDKGADALASGWRSRAYGIAGEREDCLAYGFLVSMEAVAAFHAGDPATCVDKARRARSIGERCGDETLVAWATHAEGLGLIKAGEVEKGWARLDESMVAVVSRTLRPMWAGLMHCGMMVACEEWGDPRRAWEWIEATERWLGSMPGAVLYPGVCRVHKVRMMQLRGIWPEAEAEARRACAELIGVHAFTAARAYYEIAEIKRLRGEFDEAYELYRQAHQLGWDPQPGLALLRLAQGRLEQAVAGLRRVLTETTDPLIRAGLLPYQVEVCVAAGDSGAARAADEELSGLAERYESPVITAAAATARGRVRLSEGDPEGALAQLRRAGAQWLHLGCTYEAGRARGLMAEALHAVGDEDGALLEVEAAAAIFDRIGAAPDARRVRALLERPARPWGLSDREVEVLRLVAAGRSNKQIASALFISENTVARHLQNIFAKLGVTSRAAATSMAVKQGIS